LVLNRSIPSSAGSSTEGKTMQKMRWLMLLCVLSSCAGVAHADSFSFTGTLATPESVQSYSLDLSTSETVTLQTYGFGGGTNAAGTPISPGGTDPFLAIFSGTGSGATILTDASLNPFGTSLDVSNYPSFAGCPPAGAPTIGGSAQCGDVAMNLPSLAAGIYTVVLADGEYQPNAIFDNGTLGEGFTDFTGGANVPPTPQFCNIVINGVACPANSPTLTNPVGNGAWALDILTSGNAAVNPVPEPGTLLLLGTGLLGLARLRRRRSGAA
jgi:hypothetical protein